MPDASASWRWPRIRLRPALGLLVVYVWVGLLLGNAAWLARMPHNSSVPWSHVVLWELTGAFGSFAALPLLQMAVLNSREPPKSWPRIALIHGLTYQLYFVVQVTVMLSVRYAVYALAGWGDYDYGPFTFRIPMEYQRTLLAYVLAATIWTLVLAWRDRHERALKAAQLENELRASQLQALTGQLNPHFLFNALNTVSAVMYDDLERTDRLLANIGDLLRSSLDNSGPTWTLSEELAHARRYLDILGVRFGDRLRVSWEVPPELSSERVPRFMLQTLVENATKHNADRVGALEIRIRAHVNGALWQLEVEDTGRGFGTPALANRTGVGLMHLERALRLLYDQRAQLVRGSGPEGGAKVTVELPIGALS